MGKEDDLSLAKRSYRTAKAEGNRQEEARWANVVGDILKNRGEYVEALKWLRLDYEVSVKYLPEKHLLPTCQSLGELYLRLNQFEDALIYQKKHLELAKDANDLVEQQRASTQLGRTYHEMLLRSDDDHYSVRNAKKYFRLAMKLAQSLKESPPTNNRCSFVKEYVDAHNNIGMLEKDRDNFEEAERFLTKGLEICDEEEIGENDDSRSRLHHNLGSVYLELRVWDKAMEHIEKDILICKRIGHIQGEAKGYINLGELHYRVQKYEDAIHCYKKALDLAKSMEDEDALVEQIAQNIEIVQSAMKVLDEMKKEEQILKKLTRKMETARGTPSERRCLLQQNAALDCLIEKSSMIFSWLKHREFAKRKKRIVSQLCDKEKLGDSFLVLGESYQKLRNFKKSIKWFQKGLEMYKSIGNLEGQALAKINIGDVLDSDGDWNAALHAFEDGYRLAVDAKCPSVQLSALENMHYSNMIRFDNIEEARKLQLEIDKLKQLKDEEFKLPRRHKNQCSETDSDGDDCLSDRRSTEPSSPEINRSTSSSKFLGPSEEMNDDVPLVSLLRSHKHSLRQKTVQVNNCNLSNKGNGNSPEQVSKEISAQKKVVGRKRIRLVLSDDESETQDVMNFPRARHHECLDDDIAFLNENRRETNPPGSCRFEDIKTPPSKCATCSRCSPNVEESSSSYQSLKPDAASQNNLRSSNNDLQSDFAISGCKSDVGVSDNAAFKDKVNKINLQNADSTGQRLTFMIDNDPIHVEVDPCSAADKSSTESLKAELACLYYIRLPMEKRSKGLLPIIQDMKSGGRFFDFEAFNALKEHPERLPIEVSLAWVQKRLMKLYIDCCEELSEPPNLKLLKKLYISEVEDVVSASDCELQDVSITPLLNALHTHNSIAIIDLSHNLLGNGTIEKLQKLFTSGLQYGGLTLDLHCNRFGPTALFQICECPVLFTRLEVLNISGNCLTDTCGSFLSTMLEKCKALFSLNIEHCSITSRTIQKVADSLSPQSVLAQLWIGNNNPVSGTSIINLLEKLATLRSFTELSLTNLKLNKAVTNSLCQLLKSSCMSCLMLGSTFIGAYGALQLTESLLCGSQEFAKLDFSCCAMTSMYICKLSNNVALVGGIVELNLEGNPLRQEGGGALVSILANPQCSLKILVLNKCQLGFSETLQVIYALKENVHLEELYLAENFDSEERRKRQHEQQGHSGALHPNFDMSETPKTCELKEFGVEHDVCPVNTSCNQLEVADSEDEAIRLEAAPCDSCTNSCQKHQLSDCLLLEKLSTAISLAKQLQLLDLSRNDFSSQEAETLYSAWSSKSARASPLRHITGDIVHLSTETNRCCRGRPCCRKD